MMPKYVFWGGRERGRTHHLVASELWHSTEKRSGAQRDMVEWRLDSGTLTRLQLAQENQSFLQATENSLFWMLVLGHRTAEGRRGQSNLLWLFQQVLGSVNFMLKGHQLCIFWVRIQGLEFWRRDDNGLYNLYCHPQGRGSIWAPKESSKAGLFASWISVLAAKSRVSECLEGKCITQLFVCFYLPYKQFGLLGKRNNVNRENRHTHIHALSKMLCSRIHWSQIFLGQGDS